MGLSTRPSSSVLNSTDEKVERRKWGEGEEKFPRGSLDGMFTNNPDDTVRKLLEVKVETTDIQQLKLATRTTRSSLEARINGNGITS